jgi:hypothetical protein
MIKQRVACLKLDTQKIMEITLVVNCEANTGANVALQRGRGGRWCITSFPSVNSPSLTISLCPGFDV